MKYVYKIDSPQAKEVDEALASKLVATGEWVLDPSLRNIMKEAQQKNLSAKKAYKKTEEVKAHDGSNALNK